MSTEADNRRIAKNTIVLYMRMIVMMLVGFYTSRVVLATLGIDDSGIYNVVGGVVSMFAFLNSAMVGVSQRYITFALGQNDSDRLGKTFNTCVTMHLVIAGIVLVFAEVIGLWLLNHKLVIPADRMNAAFWVFQASMVSTFVMMISVPYNGAIIAHEKMDAFAYISLLEAFAKLGIVFIVAAAKNLDSLIFYAFLLLAVQVCIRFTYQIYCRTHFKECRYRFFSDKGQFKEMLSFGGWNLFGSLASVAMNQGVNILLNMFFGPAVNAARMTSTQVENTVNGFVTNFQTAMNPQIIKTYASNDRDRMHTLVCASGRYSFFLLLLIALPLMLEIEPLLDIWLKVVPDHTANFLRLIMVINLFNTPSGAINISNQATGRVRNVQTIVGSIFLLVIPLAYLALKVSDTPESVYLVMFLIVMTAQAVRLGIVSKQIGMKISDYARKVYWPMLKTGIPASAIGIGIYLLFPEKSLLHFLIVCAVTTIGTVASVYLLGIGKDERSTVVEKVKSFFKAS